MPAAVELAHRAGSVGEVKVARHGQPQHLPKTHRHERIPGKIEVELQAVARRAEPGKRRRKIAVADALKRGPQRRKLVSQQHLEAKTDGKKLEAEEGVLTRERALLERAAPLIVAQNGPHRQLRKGNRKGGIVDEIFLRRRAAADVDEVSRALEEVKAHAQRQNKLDEGEALPGQFSPVFKKKCSVLEIDEAEQIRRQRGGKQPLAHARGSPHHQAREKIVQKKHRGKKQRVAHTCAKQITCGAAQHEHGIFAAEGDEIINRKEERQKIKKKSKVGKAHGTAPVRKCCGRGASA